MNELLSLFLFICLTMGLGFGIVALIHLVGAAVGVVGCRPQDSWFRTERPLRDSYGFLPHPSPPATPPARQVITLDDLKTELGGDSTPIFKFDREGGFSDA
jgi:hypothetical protein